MQQDQTNKPITAEIEAKKFIQSLNFNYTDGQLAVLAQFGEEYAKLKCQQMLVEAGEELPSDYAFETALIGRTYAGQKLTDRDKTNWKDGARYGSQLCLQIIARYKEEVKCWKENHNEQRTEISLMLKEIANLKEEREKLKGTIRNAGSFSAE